MACALEACRGNQGAWRGRHPLLGWPPMRRKLCRPARHRHLRPVGVRTQQAKPTHDPTRCPAWAAYGPRPVVHSGRRSLRASPPPLNPTGPKIPSNGAPPTLCAGALRATPVPPSTTTAGAATTTEPLASGHGQTATQPGTRALALLWPPRCQRRHSHACASPSPAGTVYGSPTHGPCAHGRAPSALRSLGPSQLQFRIDTSAPRGCGRAVPAGVSAR